MFELYKHGIFSIYLYIISKGVHLNILLKRAALPPVIGLIQLLLQLMHILLLFLTHNDVGFHKLCKICVGQYSNIYNWSLDYWREPNP